MIGFIVVDHSTKSKKIIEIQMNGQTIAVLQTVDGREDMIKVISAHFGCVATSFSDEKVPHIPEVQIRFNPKPYIMSPTGHILR